LLALCDDFGCFSDFGCFCDSGCFDVSGGSAARLGQAARRFSGGGGSVAQLRLQAAPGFALRSATGGARLLQRGARQLTADGVDQEGEQPRFCRPCPQIRTTNHAVSVKRATARNTTWYLKGYHSSALTKCDNQILKILVDEIQAKAFHHHTNGRPEARKIVWFGPEYTYGGTKISANDNWHPLVTSLATWLSVEYQLPVFNSCLINFYKDGSINIPWHSDDEVELGPNPTIASISIGAARDFHMRPKGSTNIAWSQRLASGSLLIMSGATQSHFQHAVLKDPKVKDLRVNLTFRLTRDGRIPEDLPVSDQANPCVLPVDSSITCDLDDEDSIKPASNLPRLSNQAHAISSLN
uniref:Fe2OG dioxygenase domain-containing protein n=1 Tax=Macrostomum lignano TaxID=282301 RepID=A0A1I8JRS9_9PLAT